MKKLNITIIGMGLIGGSIGLALKEADPDRFFITAVATRTATLELALERKAADRAIVDLTEGVADADIIFICTPVLRIVPIVEKIAPFLKQGAIITDVGSTKGYIAERINHILPPGVFYVSGHPMAGLEQSGMQAAAAHLFINKWYILVPEVSTSAEAVNTVAELIALTGAKITTMKVEDHDRCAAVISHVPHVAAAAMVHLLDFSHDMDESLKLAGGGFRDTTRIASSNADMWSDICLTNPQAITDSLQNLQAILSQVIEDIEEGDRQALHTFFSIAKKRRDALINASL